jgi:pantetheine-phosphate adenylyltransferase
MLPAEVRRRVINEVLEAESLSDRVVTELLPAGLLVDFCRDQGAHAVVRGLRGQADLAYEEPMVRMNRHLADIDTVLLLTDSRYAHISSSLVREVASLGGDVEDMLPPAAAAALRDALS